MVAIGSSAPAMVMDGTATTAPVGGVLLASAAIVAVFGPLTMRLYRT